jgi:acyl-CoA reductase-like NAD-dependent aldehyde dehydrogenase
VTLELGGKSPSILLDDAVLDQAIPSALTMAFLNSGEASAAGTRLLVPKNPLDAVKQAVRRAMRAFTVGDPADPKTAVGPMVSQRQYDRVPILHPQGHRRRRGSARRRRGPSRGSRSGLLCEAHDVRQM